MLRYAATGRPVALGWHCAGMEDASARSRSPATGAHPPSGQRLDGPHRRLEADRRSVPPRPHRAAATRQATGARETRAAHEICPETPRTPPAWCHVVANFAKSRMTSAICETWVSKSGPDLQE